MADVAEHLADNRVLIGRVDQVLGKASDLGGSSSRVSTVRESIKVESLKCYVEDVDELTDSMIDAMFREVQPAKEKERKQAIQKKAVPLREHRNDSKKPDTVKKEFDNFQAVHSNDELKDKSLHQLKKAAREKKETLIK